MLVAQLFHVNCPAIASIIMLANLNNETMLFSGDILRAFSSKRLFGCVSSEHEIW